MRFLDILKTANHNLWRSKLRTFLTLLAIFVGSFTIILNTTINAGVNNFIDRQVGALGGDGFIEVFPAAMLEQVTKSSNAGTSVIPYDEDLGSASAARITEKDLKAMRKVDGVENLEIFHMLSPEWMKLKGQNEKFNVSVEYFPEGNFNVDFIAGRMTSNDTKEHEIIINEDWLKAFHIDNAEDAIGKTIEIGIKQTAKCYTAPDNCVKTIAGTIVGVQAKGILTMDGDLHINQSFDQELYEVSMKDIPDSTRQQANVIAVGNVDPSKLEDIRKEFRELGFEFITVDDTVGFIRSFLDAILVVFNIFGAIALIAAAIGIINTLFMAVQERTREIGLNKALGLSSAKIFLEFSIEAILLGLWGSLGGTIVAMLLGLVANSALHAEGAALEAFPTFDLVDFSPATVAPIIITVMVIAFLAGTLPARRAARKDPIEALRYE